MTRAATGDVVAVAPGANVYTGLAAAAALGLLVALVVLIMKAHSVAPEWTDSLFKF